MAAVDQNLLGVGGAQHLHEARVESEALFSLGEAEAAESTGRRPPREERLSRGLQPGRKPGCCNRE